MAGSYLGSSLGVALALLGAALGQPTPGLGQTLTPADLAGTWRRLSFDGIAWDSTTGAVSPKGVEEMVVTFRPDGSYTCTSRRVQDDGTVAAAGCTLTPPPYGGPSVNTGRWTLVGDTLLAELDAAGRAQWDSIVRAADAATTDTARLDSLGKAPNRLQLARKGPTLLVRWLGRARGPATAPSDSASWERLDSTQPLPPLTFPPPTLMPTELAGTWIATTIDSTLIEDLKKKRTVYRDTTVDTLVLRADGTWAGSWKWERLTVGGRKQVLILAGCGVYDEALRSDSTTMPEVKAAMQHESKGGRWYLGPANTVVLVDTERRPLCSSVGHWRGGSRVVLRGQQLLIPNDMIYTRVGPAAP